MLNVIEGSEVSGGETDLVVEQVVTIENKFENKGKAPEKIAPDSGAQARRYAIALDSRLLFVVIAYRAEGEVPSKPKSVEVRRVANEAEGRVQIRFYLPFGAPTPSKQKADR